jgi:hypothetical protein
MQMIAILRLFQGNFSSFENRQFILATILSECQNVYNEFIFDEVIFNIYLFHLSSINKIKICYDEIKLITLK